MEYRKNKKYQKRESKYDSKLLDLTRVAHTREGGRRMSFRAVMVVGDGKGKIGVGVASGSDVAKGIQKATRMAERNMMEVPIINGTIPHRVEAKYGAAKVLLKPQRRRRGLVAGGTVRVMCNLAGIQDISSKILGATRNKLNNARAVMKAFNKLKKIKSGPEEKIVEEKEIVKEKEVVTKDKKVSKKKEKVIKKIKKVVKRIEKKVVKKIEKKEVKKENKKK